MLVDTLRALLVSGNKITIVKDGEADITWEQVSLGLELLKRRYSVFCMETGREIYDCTHPNKPLAVFGTLADAIKDASARASSNRNEAGYYERYIATVVDRMTDKEVFRTDCIETANEKLVVLHKYQSLWAVYNAGAISMGIYKLLQAKPWEEVESIVNGPDAWNNLTRYINDEKP